MSGHVGILRSVYRLLNAPVCLNVCICLYYMTLGATVLRSMKACERPQ